MISVPGSILIALAASGSCFMPFVEDIAELDEIAADAKVDKGSTKEQKTECIQCNFILRKSINEISIID